MLIADQFQEQPDRLSLWHGESPNLSQEMVKKRLSVDLGIEAVERER